MKLSRLYSDDSILFEPVEFQPGINAVIAEIRLPENKDKDTHNLGKTTLGRILDYVLLVTRDKNFFLFKHLAMFGTFVFFLEIELEDASHVTLRRSVAEASKISFKRHQAPYQDFSTLPAGEWDPSDMPFGRAKELLDGLLDWRALNPWSFRMGLAYLLRSQDDYRDVFQLRKFASAHADWKPFLAHTLGFDSALVKEHYAKEKQVEEKQANEETIRKELGGTIGDISKIEGLLLLKQAETDKKQKLVNAFDFRADDKAATKSVVDNLDEGIAALNAERYSLSRNRKKIVSSLSEDEILFNPDEATKVFSEAGVLFSGQVKKDFQQLISFNKALTEERRVFLQEELEEIDVRLKGINAELNELGKTRSDALSFLSSTDVFTKYKQLTEEVVALRADIVVLERQRAFLHRLQELRSEVRNLREKTLQLQALIEANVEQQNSDATSVFSTIRLYFNEIVEDVIDRKALLSVSPNKDGHLDFKAEILDDSGNKTSAGLGHTYGKLLCIAFDMAVLRSHLNDRYPRFVYHDGIFESLDPRKKENLVAVLRRYAELGLQPIVTLLDSELPPRPTGSDPVFKDDEIVLTLHDEGEQGRLFKMNTF